MKRILVFISLLFLLSGCAAPGERAASGTPTVSGITLTPQSASPTGQPTAPPTATVLPSATLGFTPTPSITAEPSPTALLLPTRVIKEGPSPTPAQGPTATPAPAKSLLDLYLPGAVKVAESEHYLYYAQNGYFPVDQKWWIEQAEQAYSYVSQRLNGAQVKHKIKIAFHAPDKGTCPIRGLASQDASGAQIIIYADQNSTPQYLLGVVSHETGHAINYDGFPEGLASSVTLAEGLATYGSGKYWTSWMQVSSIDDLVRGYIRSGAYEPLHENYDMHGVYPWSTPTAPGTDCLARRDKLYSEWASFVGYLIETYGWPKAHQLFKAPSPVRQPGQTIEFPPDYVGVYGKALNQLEWEWLRWLSVGGQEARSNTLLTLFNVK